MTKLKAGIVGGAGYTGGELLRMLLHHPQVEVAFVHSRSNAGNPVSSVHDDLLGVTDLQFTATLQQDVDVLFLCLGHGTSRIFLQENEISLSTRIIDLTNDFRVDPTTEEGSRSFVYGLPELNKAAIKQANAIANPGCFATAIQLSLLPLLAHIVPKDVYITGITGSTGAGQSLAKTSHFSWRQNNIQAYKTLVHQHMDEVAKSFQHVHKDWQKEAIHFVPWRGDFARGIFISTQLKVQDPLAKVREWFNTFYADSPFILLSEAQIHLKQVVNTNRCLLHLEQEGANLVVHAAIDNLLKGAVGQAIQNMNLMFGLAETAGLQLKASFF